MARMIFNDTLKILDNLSVEMRQVIFDWKVASWNRVLREIFMSIDFDPRNKIVLELGSNKGGIGLFFSMLGCKTICSDILLSHVIRAKQLHSIYGSTVHDIVTDLRSLPFPPDSLDLVIMKSVLGGVYANHGEDIADECMKEIYKVLKKGGICILLEQLKGSTLLSWQRSRKFPVRNWHYFLKKDFEKNAKMVEQFEKVDVKCLVLFSHVVEHVFSHTNIFVKAACVIDRYIEGFVKDDYKHLIGVIAVK